MKIRKTLSKKKIILVANDPGGGKIINLLSNKLSKKFKVICFLSGSSKKIFKNKNLSKKYFSNKTNIDLIKNKILKIAPSLIITAAGTYNLLEHNVRILAKKQNIKTISINDSWFEYGSRFRRTINNKTRYSVPDWIFTMDKYSKREIKKDLDKINKTNYFITGNLSLEISSKLKKIRKSNNKIKKIIFFSDAILSNDKNLPSNEGSCLDKRGNSIFGYFPHQILDKLLTILERMAVKLNRKIIFIIKPHPREQFTNLNKVARKFINSRLLKIILDKNSSPHELISKSDLITGMASIALLESFLYKKPTLSIQINLQKKFIKEDPCIANTLGWSMPCNTEKQLNKRINEFLLGCFKTNKNFKKIQYKGSIDKTLKKIYDIINKN
tara:strand:- start:738 stop:1889 length:1152 start_codon:yes stop_codon:yes gene_type:complete